MHNCEGMLVSDDSSDDMLREKQNIQYRWSTPGSYNNNPGYHWKEQGDKSYTYFLHNWLGSIDYIPTAEWIWDNQKRQQGSYYVGKVLKFLVLFFTDILIPYDLGHSESYNLSKFVINKHSEEELRFQEAGRCTSFRQLRFFIVYWKSRRTVEFYKTSKSVPGKGNEYNANKDLTILKEEIQNNKCYFESRVRMDILEPTATSWETFLYFGNLMFVSSMGFQMFCCVYELPLCFIQVPGILSVIFSASCASMDILYQFPKVKFCRSHSLKLISLRNILSMAILVGFIASWLTWSSISEGEIIVALMYLLIFAHEMLTTSRLNSGSKIITTILLLCLITFAIAIRRAGIIDIVPHTYMLSMLVSIIFSLFEKPTEEKNTWSRNRGVATVVAYILAFLVYFGVDITICRPSLSVNRSIIKELLYSVVSSSAPFCALIILLQILLHGRAKI